jgi:hypothetical protein
MIRNHIKEAGLTAVHRAMDGLAPSACKHLANKAEYYGKEFPFIYRHYEVTDIPDRHAEGGDAVVSRLIFTVRLELTDLTLMHSIVRARSYLQSSARHSWHTTASLMKPPQHPNLNPTPTSSSMLPLALMLFVLLQYVYAWS